MKKFGKIATSLIAATMLLGAVGCGGGASTGNGGDTSVPAGKKTVDLYYWNSGLGLEFMTKIVNDFNAKSEDYFVKLDQNPNASTIISTLGLGKSNKYDLYLTMLNSMQYKDDFIKLDDVLQMKPEGETKTIAQKYNQGLLESIKNADGTTQFLTYGNGWCGLVYNADVVDGVNYEVPVTTKELEALTMDIEGDATLQAKGVKAPWLFFQTTDMGYWKYPMTAWQVQYDGIDYYYNNVMQLKDENGNTPAKSVLLKKDGRYQALKVAESIITPTSTHPESTNTSHTKVQTLFLNGEAAFMPNGSWLLSESENTNNVDVRMMKMPVISSIIDVLPDKSVEDDAELSAVIKAIDRGETALKADNYTYEVTQADFDRLKEARNVMYNNGSEQYVFIPEYSNAIDGAKEFLRYFYSDEALVTFVQMTGVANSANITDTTKFDMGTLSDWGQVQAKFADELIAITARQDKASLYTNTGLDSFVGLGIADKLSATNSKDRKSADQLWTLLEAKVNEGWEDWI